MHKIFGRGGKRTSGLKTTSLFVYGFLNNHSQFQNEISLTQYVRPVEDTRTIPEAPSYIIYDVKEFNG